jgi:phospholipid/cholesterol/gamma-HCH transport system substrate-binding protein
MKTETSNRTKLGLFVTTGIILFMAAIYFIGAKQQLFNDTFRVSAQFNDVSGLQVGNNVRFAGITVGTIENIEIVNDTTVKVDMIVNSDTKQFIRKDSKAVIGSDGLMGSKIMNIMPGTAGQPEVDHNDLIVAVQPHSIDDIVTKLRTTVDNAALISGDLSAIFHSMRQGKGTMGKLLMDEGFAENIDRTISNVQQGTKGFKENMDAAQNSFLLRGYFKKKKKKEEKELEKGKDTSKVTKREEKVKVKKMSR